MTYSSSKYLNNNSTKRSYTFDLGDWSFCTESNIQHLLCLTKCNADPGNYTVHEEMWSLYPPNNWHYWYSWQINLISSCCSVCVTCVLSVVGWGEFQGDGPTEVKLASLCLIFSSYLREEWRSQQPSKTSFFFIYNSFRFHLRFHFQHRLR